MAALSPPPRAREWQITISRDFDNSSRAVLLLDLSFLVVVTVRTACRAGPGLGGAARLGEQPRGQGRAAAGEVLEAVQPRPAEGGRDDWHGDHHRRLRAHLAQPLQDRRPEGAGQ